MDIGFAEEHLLARIGCLWFLDSGIDLLTYHSEHKTDIISLDKAQDIPSCEEARKDSDDHEDQQRVQDDADVSSVIVGRDHE